MDNSLPAYGSASGCGCSNSNNWAPHGFSDYGVNTNNNAGCAFPAPPCARVYCQPAPFTSSCGNPYQRICSAYGKSRPSC